MSLSAPSVKRRVDALRASGAITASNADLEGVIRRLQLDGSVRRTRSQLVAR